MYKKLEPALKAEVKEKIELFKDKKQHKKLGVHKLHGISNTYSFSVNYKIRIVFDYENQKCVNFLYVGDHSVYNK
jgi:plasmid maintenance system killer protein